MKTPLFLALLLPSACTDMSGALCTFFCTDTTSIQRNYNEQRDECRQLAELKMNNMQQEGEESGTAADKAGKARLVSMFSECMNNKSWAVPSPDDKKKGEAPPVPPAAQEFMQPVSPQVVDAARQRSADCAFARQAADSSMIAKKRAEACDIECAQSKRLAPESPPSPACP